MSPNNLQLLSKYISVPKIQTGSGYGSESILTEVIIHCLSVRVNKRYGKYAAA